MITTIILYLIVFESQLNDSSVSVNTWFEKNFGDLANATKNSTSAPEFGNNTTVSNSTINASTTDCGNKLYV